jgi:hypothetical protein
MEKKSLNSGPRSGLKLSKKHVRYNLNTMDGILSPINPKKILKKRYMRHHSMSNLKTIIEGSSKVNSKGLDPKRTIHKSESLPDLYSKENNNNDNNV